jgi:S1-C subfamily serine protease
MGMVMRTALLALSAFQAACAAGSRNGQQTPTPRPDVAPSFGTSAPSSSVLSAPAPHPSSDILRRTFKIRFGDQPDFGTGFTVEVDGRQYLITAAHVVAAGLAMGLPIEVEKGGDWQAMLPTLVGITTDSRGDLAVLALDRRLGGPDDPPIQLAEMTVFMGDHLLFAGFPFGLGIPISGGYPIPLMKAAMLSGFTDGYWFLDAMNNEGFSGGPVFVDGRPIKVIGVVTGYVQTPHAAADSKDGGASGLVVMENSGIMYATKIGFATAVIRQRPVGFKLSN